MSRRIPGKVNRAISEIRREMSAIYKDRLKNLILYGSFARGDFETGSDIDIIVLLDHLTDIRSERARYSSIISELSLKYDTVISILPFDSQDFQNTRTPLILNVNKEGIIL